MDSTVYPIADLKPYVAPFTKPICFIDSLIISYYSVAYQHYQQHSNYYSSCSYGLSKEDINWWIHTNYSIRWSDIHADSYRIDMHILFEICQFIHPILASKIITQHLNNLWSLKRITLFLLLHGNELNDFVIDAIEKKYSWNYIKEIVTEYADIHFEYWLGASITTLCELTYYHPYVVITGLELDALCQQTINLNPKSVEDYKKGKLVAIKQLIGCVMKLSSGKADINMTTDILKLKLMSDTRSFIA